MLVTLEQILKIAEERKIAVGSFNSPNLESLQAILEAAEELGLPVILQFAQCHDCLLYTSNPIGQFFTYRGNPPRHSTETLTNGKIFRSLYIGKNLSYNERRN